MAETTKSISEKLAKYIESNKDVEILVPTMDRHSGLKSSWSLSFKSKKGEELETLSKIFGYTINETIGRLFETATTGDGDEKSKILTIHSSSLLAFLCFCDVANHPIKIDGIEYDEVMFEVKNDVIDASLGKPSNIDILLMGENRKKLLFLESKFTEYLKGGKVFLSSERYKQFYILLLEKDTFPFSTLEVMVTHKPGRTHNDQYTTNKICLYQGKRTSGYLGGIKQAFSHLLGIATGPANEQQQGNEAYKSILRTADEIKFASIVFNCDNEKLHKYSELYSSVFSKSDAIKEAISEVLQVNGINCGKILGKLVIVPSLMTYQDVFKDNYLCEDVRTFYSQVNASN